MVLQSGGHALRTPALNFPVSLMVNTSHDTRWKIPAAAALPVPEGLIQWVGVETRNICF